MKSVRLRRLKSDYESIRRLVRLHPKIDIEGVSGSPPNRYIFVLHVKSLRETQNDIVTEREHRLEVKLPLGYPRDAPLCRMLTPVFHPNIAPHAVCVGDHWSAAESLDLMVQRVGEMLAYQSYNIKSPLNGRAAQWVVENAFRVPTDREEFFVDLSSATPLATGAAAQQCANCQASNVALESCQSGHALCADCRIQCADCGRLQCLVCEETRCPACHSQSCANCGGAMPDPLRCAGGHESCADCAMPCQQCSRVLCLVCGTFPCPDCSDPSARATAPA